MNKVIDEKVRFGGTPAVSSGRLILRSDKHLYGIVDKGSPIPTVKDLAGRIPGARQQPGGELSRRPAPGVQGGGAGGGRGRGGNGRFDPMSLFNSRDTDRDGKLSEDELTGPMADRLKTLDKDGDKLVSQEEFRSVIGSLFRRGGNSSGGRSYGGGKDTRPDRPQRPELAK